MNPASPITTGRANALLRDLNAGFAQQMFFWGMDAAIPSRNLFQKSGFAKSPSPSEGIKGTSCYSLPWQNGHIFLHGTCVGWLSEKGGPGFIYIRPSEKCFLWLGPEPPVPGTWPEEMIAPLDLSEDIGILTTFLSWWLAHESWVSAEMGTAYRAKCHRKYKSLPKSKPWLSPVDSVAWISLFVENPAATPRAKRFSHRIAA